ncbi:Mitochondrial intermembrane space import and assembly protein 40-B [Anthophora plagiata]
MYYLDVSLILPSNPNSVVSAVYLKKNIFQSVKQLFGEEGTKYTVDILKYNPEEHRFILRCTDDCYVRLRAALTVAGTYEGEPCNYLVHRATANLLSFSSDKGKDTIIFASKEDHATPSKVDLPQPEPSPGLLLSNGEINWNCPCLGGMATGPCGLEFREAFSCYHYSTAEPKGSDCYDAFKTMQTCMIQYPALYGKRGDSMDDLEDETDLMDDHKKNLESDNKVYELESDVKEVPDTPSIKKGIERTNVK